MLMDNFVGQSDITHEEGNILNMCKEKQLWISLGLLESHLALSGQVLILSFSLLCVYLVISHRAICNEPSSPNQCTIS